MQSKIRVADLTDHERNALELWAEGERDDDIETTLARRFPTDQHRKGMIEAMDEAAVDDVKAALRGLEHEARAAAARLNNHRQAIAKENADALVGVDISTRNRLAQWSGWREEVLEPPHD